MKRYLLNPDRSGSISLRFIGERQDWKRFVHHVRMPWWRGARRLRPRPFHVGFGLPMPKAPCCEHFGAPTRKKEYVVTRGTFSGATPYSIYATTEELDLMHRKV